MNTKWKGKEGKDRRRKKLRRKGVERKLERSRDETGMKPEQNRNEMGTKFEKIEEGLGAVEADLPGGWTKSQRRTDDRRIFKDKVDL